LTLIKYNNKKGENNMLNDLNAIVQPILDICNTLVPIMLAVVGSVGALWCILLGVKYAKAEDPQEHEKAKGALKNAIIGFVMIFLLIVMLQFGLEAFMDYLGYDSESWTSWFVD
jgi:amino acid transporter